MRIAKKVVKEPEIKFHIGQIIPGNRKITDIKFSPRQLLIETKITIYCMECKKKTDYAYKTINNIANGDSKSVCKKCFNRKRLKESIITYQSRVGEIFNIHKITKCIKYSSDPDKAKYLCECLKCGGQEIRRFGTFRPSNKIPRKRCKNCPDKSVLGGYTFTKNVDLTGLKFGIFTVIGFSHFSENGSRMWKTKCSCGEITIRPTGDLSRIFYGDNRDSCKNCRSLFRTTFTVGTVASNGDKIINLDHDKKLITFKCSSCNFEHISDFYVFSTRVYSNTVHCLKCCNITHNDSTSKFYIEWTRIINKLDKNFIPYDSRWEDYTQFKEDMFDTYIENYKLISSSNIWNIQNCKWVQKIKK